jgi:hypothetical protein
VIEPEQLALDELEGSLKNGDIDENGDLVGATIPHTQIGPDEPWPEWFY